MRALFAGLILLAFGPSLVPAMTVNNYVNSNTLCQSTTTTSCSTGTLTHSTGSGNMAIFCAYTGSGTVSAPSTGGTWVASNVTGTGLANCWTNISLTGGLSSLTATVTSGAGRDCVYLEVQHTSGADLWTVDVSAQTTSYTASAPAPGQALTLTGANDVILQIGANWATNATNISGSYAGTFLTSGGFRTSGYIVGTASGTAPTWTTAVGASASQTQIGAIAITETNNTCTDAATGNWSASGSWSGCAGTVPQTGDFVSISAGHTITLDTNTNAIGSLTVSNSSTLNTDGLAAHTLTLNSTGTTCGTNVSGIVIQAGTVDFTAATFADNITITAPSGTNPIYVDHALCCSAVATLNGNYVTWVNLGTGSGTCIGIGNSSAAYNFNISLNQNLFKSGNESFSGNLNPTITNSIWYQRAGKAISINGQNPGSVLYNLTNNTDYLPQSASGAFVSAINNTPDGLTASGNAAYRAANVSTQFFTWSPSTAAANKWTLQYNIDYFDPTATSTSTSISYQVAEATPSKASVLSFNMSENALQAYYPMANSSFTWTQNWASSNLSSVTGQGIYFMNGTSGVPAFQNDVAAFDNTPTSGADERGFFVFNASSPALSHDTVWFPNSPTCGGCSYASGFVIGDNGILPIGGGTLTNLLIQGGNWGVWDSSANTYAGATCHAQTSGICNVNQTGGATFDSAGSSTNYGTHPSTGDTSLTPGFVDPTRRYPQADASLGGPGTVAHLFQTLACRTLLAASLVGCTNNAAFTPQNIYTYLWNGFAPTNISLASYGAVPPVVTGAWIP